MSVSPSTSGADEPGVEGIAVDWTRPAVAMRAGGGRQLVDGSPRWTLRPDRGMPVALARVGPRPIGRQAPARWPTAAASPPPRRP